MVTIDGVNYISSTRMPKNGENSSPYLILRLLLGTLRIEVNSAAFKQPINFLSLPAAQQQLKNAAAVDEFLLQFSIPSSAEFVRRTISDNRAFYRDLLAEYSQYFLQTKNLSHVSAFVFLYRILERISYSLPLLYCSIATEYRATFDLLKKLFVEAGGELSFFKKFLHDTDFIDSLILDTTYDIAFIAQDGQPARYYKTITRIFNEFAGRDEAQNSIKIEFRHMSEFIVNLRNRFLHARTGDGQTNVLVSQIKNPDELFAQLNPAFASFLAQVTLHMLGNKYA